MVLFPLPASDSIKPHDLILEQPLEKDRVKVTELNQDGSVPAVRMAEKEQCLKLRVKGRLIPFLEATVSKKTNDQYSISVIADHYKMNVPAPKHLLEDLVGPPGFRTDNGVFRLNLYSIFYR